jgi:hypothetical protein
MTSLSDVAELVRVGNDDTDESNKTLKSIDAKFDKFFKLAERSRLDDLEARLDKSRALKPSNIKSRGVLGTIGAGAGAISDLVKALMNPMNWLKALGFAALAPGSVILKGLYNKIRNVMDDTLKTRRGILRIEADELKRMQKAEKARIQEELDKERYRRASEVRRAKDLIRDAEKEYQKNKDAKDAKARRAASMRQARMMIAEADARVQAAKDLKAQQKDFSKRLNRAYKKGSTATLSSVVAEGNQFYSNAKPPGVGAIENAVTKPVKTGPPPGVLSNAKMLSAVPDTILTKVGVYRDIQADGRVAYKSIMSNVYVGHAALLEEIKVAEKKPVKAMTMDNVKNTVSNKINKVGTSTFKGAGVVLAPEAYLAETALNTAANATKGSVIGKGLGFAAKALTGVAFNAAMLSFMPTTMDRDNTATISGGFDNLYNNMVGALLAGDAKGLVVARDALKKYVTDIGGGDLTFMSGGGEVEKFSKYILGLNEKDLKAFSHMSYAKRNGTVARYNNGEDQYDYSDGLQTGRREIFPPSMYLNFRERLAYSPKSGDELSALDAISANREMLGQNTAIGQVDASNTTYNSGSVSLQANTSTKDLDNGGGFNIIGGP